MKRGYLFLITLIIIATVYSIGFYKKEKNKGEIMENVSLSILLGKNNYKVGNKIDIEYIIENKGEKPIRLLPWGFEYATNVIDVFDKHENYMKELRLFIYELKFVPSKEDFVVLEQNKPFKKVLSGIITREILQGLGSSPEKIEGLFINFKNSAIFLQNDYGEYIIKSVYKANIDAIEEAKKRYGYTDIYVGKLESNELRFFVTE